MLIDIQVNVTATCNDRQQVGLIQASPEPRRGACAQHVVTVSGVVYGGFKGVGPIAVDVEGIILRL